ncbi:MAG: hypothetical protein GY943_06255 [Chloroflexi bacterium]|nr:hypothetical protein [Chloroflexota bacterium]
MTRKKKRLSRKQIKQRQQAQKTRIRQKQGWSSPPQNQANTLSSEEANALDAYVFGDKTTALENISKILSESIEWVDEPEFADIFLSPIESMEAFASEIEKRGYSPQSFAELDQDAQDDLHIEITRKIITQLLTNDKRQDIVDALDTLSQRWRRHRKKQQADEVTIARLFLTDFAQEMSEDAWLMLGLIHALIERSIAAGFEIMKASHPSLTAQADNDFSIIDVIESIPAIAEKSVDKLLKRVPGLRRFLEKQSDEVWDEGMNAVYTGDLYLELFTEDELNGAVQIMQTLATKVKSRTQSNKIPNKQLKSFVHQIDEYVIGLITPARLTQLRTRIREILQKEQVDRHWLPFVAMLYGYFREEDAVEQERPFLSRIIMGELRIAVEQMATATDEEE